MEPLDQLMQTAVAHHQARRLHQAEKIYRAVLEREPRHADAWHLLGMIAHEAKQNRQAIDLIGRAIALDPDKPGYYNNLATIHENENELEAAVRCLQQALRQRPDYAAAWHNLGEVRKAQGRVRDALDAYLQAIRHSPHFFASHDSLLMLLNYDPRTSASDVAAAHRRYGALLPTVAACPARPTEPDRPLRVGYVSPDLRRHAVARFLEPILAHHDRAQFQVYLYGEIPGEDDVTRRLKTYAAGYWMTSLHPTAEVVERIRTDRIDILVDLAGHTRHNRLDVFPFRPAPVQCTYLGYSNTTGLDSVDYRITDCVVDPPDSPLWTSEQLVRLDHSFGCFQPPAGAPEVSSLPAARSGTITFGSHHPLVKLNDDVLALWGRVMQRVPTARLLCLRDNLGGELGQRLLKMLATHGIGPERVGLRSPDIDERNYLKLFAEIDIVLDAFPFNSHTMSCESLWMGVPLVTLRGDRPTSRLSSSVLTALGLNDWIADTPDAFVDIAARQAADLAGLARVRGDLRSKMLASVCDGASFTRELEAAYRQMWRNACAGAKAEKNIQ
jgi:predicted O-linked N-acetylglucosamine transferase (SPINDLY family)